MSFNRWAARSKTTLQSLNITHILNAADGPYSINTGAKYYKDLQIEYYGVEAFDDPSFDISIFFYDAANFIGKALNTSGGKVFVHCAMGISRSASLVLAFLMIHENMTLVDALKTILNKLNTERIEVCCATGTLGGKEVVLFKGNSRHCSAGPSTTRMAWDSLCSRDLLRPKIRSSSSQMPGSPCSTETPSLEELRRLLWTHRHPTGHVDEVWPNLYVGDLYVARDKAQLSRMGISHVVDAAAGRFHIDTGPKFYKDLSVDYYGVEAEDNPNFDLSIYFYPVARYIRAALNSPRGKVLVHCAMGISRSATLVLAFLMICEDMSLTDAIQTVRSHRGVCPNSGFLQQLRELDIQLGRRKGRGAETC
ncbi:dual specificity protein phosphatase 13 [Patagioenas fasciata monilis]|uniref:Dual specificity protein phosphatase 13 n=1 Tax=Patagioenas fasciata monilis TaxID=372326 RepID=A0A1V4KJH2_PATFA|nr:dual specificity protein phosphatase 13 [Patagioenas fasciata monilis]